MIRIYTDENNRDEEGNYELHCRGSMVDIEKYQDQLFEGLVVMLNVQDEFEMQGTLFFDRIWMAIPDVSTLRYYDEESS